VTGRFVLEEVWLERAGLVQSNGIPRSCLVVSVIVIIIPSLTISS
jgi:hypothetical protein